MEADWDELTRIPMPPPGPHALPTIATTVAFDDVMELLWTGNEYVSRPIESNQVDVITQLMRIFGS